LLPGYEGDALTGRPDSCKRQTGPVDYPDYEGCSCNLAGSLSQDCDEQRRWQGYKTFFSKIS